MTSPRVFGQMVGKRRRGPAERLAPALDRRLEDDAGPGRPCPSIVQVLMPRRREPSSSITQETKWGRQSESRSL